MSVQSVRQILLLLVR